MKDLSFRLIEPYELLKPHISRIFVFECRKGIRKGDAEIIVPNGQMKLVIPYKNNMTSSLHGVFREHKESSVVLIGLSTDRADIECDDDYGNICVEFKTMSAYRFFNFPMHHLAHNMINTPDLLDKMGAEIQEKLQYIENVDAKVEFVQAFLCKQLFAVNKFDPISEYAIQKIVQSKGLITVDALSKELGYSRRYLTTKFASSIGISPKELSSIVRFQEIFKNIGSVSKIEYDFFYDQSHYIKEFKKFTGFTPQEYLAQCNKLRCLL